jgi:hypothetical protein
MLAYQYSEKLILPSVDDTTAVVYPAVYLKLPVGDLCEV